ncbi:DUF4153 domain-containing protein [soil metagenome]
MREEIMMNIDNPGQLEKLYRDNKTGFRKEFNAVYNGIREHAVAQAWHERLNYEQEEITWGTRKELIFVFVACFIAGLIAKIPDYTQLDPEQFYTRNIAFIIFPILTAYFAWKQKINSKKLIFIAAVFLVSGIYINLLPGSTGDTLILACIHLPLFLWAVLGYTFTGNEPGNLGRRLDFLRYNGDMIVMTGLILIAGGALTAITFNLFNLIDLKIDTFFEQYVVVWGLPAAPIIATQLVRTNPHLVNKISPVIAKLFTPLVLLMLTLYLVAVIITGKDPYNDREFLLIFNALLIGVMAIIFFSIAENQKNPQSKVSSLLLFGLSIITVIVNGIALSAIIFRIFEFGITPNRLAVLGGNILMLANLLIVGYRLYKTIKDSNEIEKVENSIAAFLPIYATWTLVVIFVLPLVFNFR